MMVLLRKNVIAEKNLVISGCCFFFCQYRLNSLFMASPITSILCLVVIYNNLEVFNTIVFYLIKAGPILARHNIVVNKIVLR